MLQTTQPIGSGSVTAVSNCCANCDETSRPQQSWSDLPFLCKPARWLALILIKAGDVETNPGPTTTHKQIWIWDIFHIWIHGRRHISIKCNRIKHWVHLRCAGMRLAQYTYTCACHLHNESGLTTHTDITPPYPSRPWSSPYPLPTCTTHTTATQTQTHVQHSPCSHKVSKAQTQCSHSLAPLLLHSPAPNTYIFHTLHQPLSSHAPHSSLLYQVRKTPYMNHVYHPHVENTSISLQTVVKPLPTPHMHHPHYRNTNTDTRPTLPCSHKVSKAQTQCSHSLAPLLLHSPAPNTYIFHTLHQPLSSHAPHSSLLYQLRKTPYMNHVYHPHALHSPQPYLLRPPH